ncbi:hypothetical protein BCR44DRAFT_1459953 [Catenaria anguillulae PL171]|uniref:Uncharacterized protein n=1 Tax=Catenaria anguillulae PL171 TaxID=765915 RepID=A0A1Y2HSP3_9FUNG|nr:hypothetical protein BCR44DRAFT_1459953 [Catenaria anguillulae PL171]
MNNAVKVLKFFSVSSLGLSLIGMPLSMFFVDSALMQSNAVAAVMLSPTLMGSVTLFSTLSTLAAHKFLSPYVTRIFLIPPPSSSSSLQADQPSTQQPSAITDDTTLAIETLTLLNTRRYTTVRMSELAYSTKSTITWELRDPSANPPDTASKFMILLRKSGMSPEMRGCLQYIASKYRLLTMSDLTSEQLLTKLKGMSPPPVVGRPPKTQ